ncbi:hypothetical protein GCM10009839_52220 [Catenulispora yoronensis]|uniref:Cardiolipin synthase N-terminal domain-containing protein n=1 Tax=Catenulispora yoronensis TaxID=450799 RepID=A0ABP5GA65_9ACTN
MHSRTSWAAFAPIVLLAVAFVVYCLIDLARRPDTRHLPRWGWAVLCCAAVPLGAIAYLLVGRGER